MRLDKEQMKMYALILLVCTIIYTFCSMSGQVIDKKMGYDGDSEEWIERNILQ